MSLPVGLKQGLSGSVEGFHIEVKKLKRPYRSTSPDIFQALCDGNFDYYLTNDDEVVTFGTADGGFALMPLGDKDAKKVLAANDMETVEAGYEDIFSNTPYFDIETDGDRALLHIMYVPPRMRRNGVGRELFNRLLSELAPDIRYIRLRAATLGSGCTMSFWRSLGFTPAYTNADPADEGRILHRAVNGFDLPAVEALADGDTRHYIFD